MSPSFLPQKSPGRPRAIASLQVEGLFGHFDYAFPSLAASTVLPPDLLILYGDNGSGKTTILNLIYHAISPGRKHGHRNALQKIPFRTFSIGFHDGSIITFRRNEDLLGGYAVDVLNATGAAIHTTFSIEREDKFSTDDDEKRIIEFLNSLNQAVYFVSADRHILSDELRDNSDPRTGQLQLSFVEADAVALKRAAYELQRRPETRGYRPESRRAPAIIHATELAKKFITEQAFGATRRGSESTHGIYTEIIKRLAKSQETTQPSDSFRHDLIATLNTLSDRSKRYARLGFTTDLDVAEMITAVSTSPDDRLGMIAHVLQPYIEGTNATLDELAAIFDRTSKIINTLGEFYADKFVDFSFRRGFLIRSRYDNKHIEPTFLSSGEQQLLLLFCYALVSSTVNSVIIIDEPELSLNIKWQRVLLGALLEIVSGGMVQFVFATHSVDLIGEHLDHVLKLAQSGRESNSSRETGIASADH